jgi:hypothetical protein
MYLAALYEPKRPHFLADAVLVDGHLGGVDFGDEVAARVAHHHFKEHFTSGALERGAWIGGRLLREARSD